VHAHHIGLELCEVNHRAYDHPPLLLVPLRPYQHFQVERHMLFQLTQNMVEYEVCVGDSQGLIQSIELDGDGARGKKFGIIVVKEELVCCGDYF